MKDSLDDSEYFRRRDVEARKFQKFLDEIRKEDLRKEKEQKKELIV